MADQNLERIYAEARAANINNERLKLESQRISKQGKYYEKQMKGWWDNRHKRRIDEYEEFETLKWNDMEEAEIYARTMQHGRDFHGLDDLVWSLTNSAQTANFRGGVKDLTSITKTLNEINAETDFFSHKDQRVKYQPATTLNPALEEFRELVDLGEAATREIYTFGDDVLQYYKEDDPNKDLFEKIDEGFALYDRGEQIYKEGADMYNLI